MYKGSDYQTCMNMICQDMQQEQKEKDSFLGEGKLKQQRHKKWSVANFGEISEMFGPSVYYKLTSYDNIVAWNFLLAIALTED